MPAAAGEEETDAVSDAIRRIEAREEKMRKVRFAHAFVCGTAGLFPRSHCTFAGRM